MGFLDAIIPRKLRSTIVLGALVIVAQMVCEKLEAPSWVGFVVAAVLGGLYHSVFMQVDMIGTKAAPLVDLDYIQGEGLKLNGGSPTIVRPEFFSTYFSGKKDAFLWGGFGLGARAPKSVAPRGTVVRGDAAHVAAF